MTPLLPKAASSAASELVTMVITTSDARATSAQLLAEAAPRFTSGSIAAATISNMVREKPAFNRFPAMCRPMMPSPINPIFGFI